MTPSDRAEFVEFKDRVRVDVEDRLERYLSELTQTQVSEVATYVVLGGGHRWRAMTTIAAGSVFERGAAEICLPCACGIELAHAASMLLDDLPSMDDARYRRGKLCAHHVFPRWAVDLAPLLMVNLAYEICLSSTLASAERRVSAATELSRASRWMIDGQEDDLAPARTTFSEERLLECYARKSGALYGASAKAGGVLCGAAEDAAEDLYECGVNMGIAYQILDDITDVVAGIEEVGKETGMDAGKTTTIDLLGMARSQGLVIEYQDRALSHLSRFDLPVDHPLMLLVRLISVIPGQA